MLVALCAAPAACDGGSDALFDAGPDAAPEFQFYGFHLGEHSTCDLASRTSPRGEDHFCWGHNEAGVLGTGDEGDRTEPVAVLTDVELSPPLYAGLAHRCALEPGTDHAFCWGANESGQLGIGNRETPQLAPQPVAGDLPFGAHMAAGHDHTCGIAIDNHAYCWGSNAYGQLGHDSSSTEELAPVQVAGGYFFSRIAAGDRFTCGIVLPGFAVYCWGLDSQGQLGDGGAISGMETSLSRRPVKVATDRPMQDVAAGGGTACAIDEARTVFCWGANDVGQLGSGDTESRSSPTEVMLDDEVNSIDVGGRHVCAIAGAFPRAWCWGANEYGQLGVADPDDLSPEPVPVSGDMMLDEVAVSEGEGGHSCAVSNTFDAAYCWGRNDFGQLGDGAPRDGRVDSPQPVLGQP